MGSEGAEWGFESEGLWVVMGDKQERHTLKSKPPTRIQPKRQVQGMDRVWHAFNEMQVHGSLARWLQLAKSWGSVRS